MFHCCVSLVLASLVAATHAVSHTTTLMWTEKAHHEGSVRIVGIPSTPSSWIPSRRFPPSVGQSTPFDPNVRRQSARIALGFQYSKQKIYWSDRGFRQIMRTMLQEVDTTPYLYNATVNRVYTGISREVNGLAVDWLSGSVYWTDALYNWITVAAAEKHEVYRHLVTNDLEKPMGICVWPQKGYMYWADMGGVPRIERARLDGSERTALVTSDLDHPKGITIDIANGFLYWVDDFQDTVNRLQLSTMDRIQYNVPTGSPNQHNTLFGITVFQDFVFVTDQTYHEMKIYNRTNGTWVFNAALLDLPYDIMMYDESLQEEIPSDCPTLGCEDICVSTGDGGGKCMCRQSYDLDLNGKTCKRSHSLTQPAFLYSIGRSLCGTRIEIADRDQSHPADDVECFYNDVTHARSLAFHSRAELVYYSDFVDRTIHRLKVTDGFRKDTIAAQTGQVKGLCVDWLTDNLYWTDETRGHMYVSRIDGRYPHLLLQNLGMPRGVAVHPVKGKLYWSDGASSTIFRANMDGTNMEVFQNDISPPDGLTFDVVENRLYWVDETGISSVSDDGLDKKILVHDPMGHFRDLTLFQDYFAYTDGESSVFYGPKSTGEAPRAVQHIDSHVSHDIISYDGYLQPTGEPGKCNVESAMCEQLCLPNDSGFTCKCAYGFRLAEDGYSCDSDLTDMNFLLFVDPYQRQIYQLNLEFSNANPQGIHIPTPEFPTVIDVDAKRGEVYWLDESERVIKKAPLLGGRESVSVVVPETHRISSFAVSSLTQEVLFCDSFRQSIYRSGIKHGDAEYLFASNVVATRMLVHEEERTLYWVQRNQQGSSFSIYRQHLDQTNSAVRLHVSQGEITGLGIDREAKLLYWCTAKQIERSALDGKDVALVTTEDDGSYSGLAVTPVYIYFVHKNQMAVYRRTHATGQVNKVTEDFFSRIIDIKDFSWIKPGSQFVDENGRLDDDDSAAPSTEKPTNMTLVFAIVAATGALLLLVLIIAIVVYKVHQKRKLPPGDFETQAHENPTYATTVVPEPDPIYHTLGGTRRPASAGSRDSDLPDVVKLPLPEDEPTGGAVGAGVQQRPEKDTEHLVKPSEVLFNVNGGVQFKPIA